MAHADNIGFIPTVSPGFNDAAVRSGHAAAPRYETDVPGSAEGSLFADELNRAALPNLDPAAENILMVNSFNEWHEDTQIEPTNLATATTADDASGTLTQGYSYPGYGDLYLNELRTATVPEPTSAQQLILGSCLVSLAVLLRGVAVGHRHVSRQ